MHQQHIHTSPPQYISLYKLVVWRWCRLLQMMFYKMLLLLLYCVIWLWTVSALSCLKVLTRCNSVMIIPRRTQQQIVPSDCDPATLSTHFNNSQSTTGEQMETQVRNKIRLQRISFMALKALILFYHYRYIYNWCMCHQSIQNICFMITKFFF